MASRMVSRMEGEEGKGNGRGRRNFYGIGHMNERAVRRAMFMASLWLLLFVERRGRIEMSSAAAASSVQGEDEVAR
jgi:hypothetical protein